MSKNDGGGGSATTKKTSLKSILLLILVAVLGIICLQNLTDTPVQLLFWRIELPLIVILGLAALLGFGIGWVISHWRND